MRSWHKTIVAASALWALTGSYALAQGPAWNNASDKAKSQTGPNGNGNAYGIWGKPSGNKGVPGPIAGAGLPFLLLAGGYVLIRRYRRGR
jgi:hypothetical protein